MAWSWGDTIDASFDWTSKDTLNIFDQAVYERCCAYLAGVQAYSSGGTVPPVFYLGVPATTVPPNPVPAVWFAPWSSGDDIQLCQNITHPNAVTPFEPPLSGYASILAYQQCIEWASQSWVDGPIDLSSGTPGVTLMGDLVSPHFLTLNSILRGYGYTDSYDFPSTDLDVSWHRETPRVVRLNYFGPTPTQDTEGNAFADGMLAIVNPQYDLFPTGATFTGKYDAASSTWLPQPVGTRPDTLKSNQASPNFCMPGQLRPGDYIGHWLFLQLMQVMQKMKWRAQYWNDADALASLGAETVNRGSADYPVARASPAVFTSMADAKSNADAGWAVNAATAPNFYDVGGGTNLAPSLVAVAQNYNTDSTTSDPYEAGEEVWGINFEFGTFPTSVSKEIEIWAGVLTASQAGIDYFDNAGNGGTPGAYYKFYDSGANTSATVDPPAWPDPSLKPNWPPDPPYNTEYQKGMYTHGGLVLYTYSFTQP